MKFIFVTVMGLILSLLVSSASAMAGKKDPWCDGAPDEYVIEDVKARVVDSETGEPIEGAVVVGQWYTVRPREYLKITEAVTDKNGEFLIPGWGPFKKPKQGCLFADDPLLKIFKSGYFAWQENNSVLFEINRGPNENINPVSAKVRKFRFSNKTIQLEKLIIGKEIEGFDYNGQPAKRPLTEEDYCFEVSKIFDGFSTNPVEFSLPNLLAAMKEDAKIHPDCTDRTYLLEPK